jgi:NAD binding domain of 6-phosphogluconate dehydrogenase
MTSIPALATGFIGLGTMGEPMALNIVKAGTPSIVWNRSASKCASLADAGATVARNVGDLFARCGVVILMLADGASFDAVLARGSSAFARGVQGRTLINMATVPPAYSKMLEVDTRAAGGRYVEAPVSGSRKPAEAGQLVAARATTATVSNLGFLGPPIVLTFFGAHGAGPLAMAIVCEVMILMSVGAVIMAGADKAAAAGSLILRSTVYNPVVAAILACGAIAASGLVLSMPLNGFLSFLAGSAAPTALFAVGGALAMQRIDRTTAYAAAGISLVKLLMYPLTVWCLLAYALHVEPFWIGVGVVIASLPPPAAIMSWPSTTAQMQTKSRRRSCSRPLSVW